MIAQPPKTFADLVSWAPPTAGAEEVHGTTVLALRCAEGAIVLADRRATMGNLIMYEKAEKIEVLDPWTVTAISGAYARSLEICRFLRHSFKYYERLTLQEMSTEGKLMEISRALAGNQGQAMQGVGMFLPVAAAYDQKKKTFGVYFFDAAGARFQEGGFACAGSGSERIRGVLEYIRLDKGPWEDRPQKDVLADGLRLLDIASSLDSATGGIRSALPIAYTLTAEGCTRLTEKAVNSAAAALK
jgi:proteasome beta subunit